MVVSTALILEKEIDDKLKKISVYSASEALSGSKIHYSELQKIAYAVVMEGCKLRHYFEGHRIVAVTNQPLHDLFSNREAWGRIVKWASELSEFVVDFERRSTIKSQVLADFIVDWTSPKASRDDVEIPWVIYCDDAWCYKGAAIAAIVTSPIGIKIRYDARLKFPEGTRSTNNMTEYEVLLMALRKMKALGQQAFIVKIDSKVIKEHIEKDSKAKEPKLVKYLTVVRTMEKHFTGFTVKHISRAENDQVDKLAKAAAQNEPIPPNTLYEVIKTPSTKEPTLKYANVTQHFNWRAKIMAYMRGHFEPCDEVELTRLKQKTKICWQTFTRVFADITLAPGLS
ncbi:uncharacterized protein [Setaria viridis]|uniref:uncharacterized protein n=1 Tax=Setaria viridis TaxID=4556 RepID=UPI003B3A715D